MVVIQRPGRLSPTVRQDKRRRRSDKPAEGHEPWRFANRNHVEDVGPNDERGGNEQLCRRPRALARRNVAFQWFRIHQSTEWLFVGLILSLGIMKVPTCGFALR